MFAHPSEARLTFRAAPPPPSQTLSLYTKDLDGSVKAVVAAKLGGLDIAVHPIAEYKGTADVSKVRSPIRSAYLRRVGV